MTHPIAELDAATFAVWLFTTAVVTWRGIRTVGRARWVLVGLAATTAAHTACMLLEWLGVTRALEHLEDYLGATLPMWWAFAVYAFAEEADARELRESRARFRALVDQAADAFYLTDRNGGILDVNQETCRSLGYSRDELLAASVDLFEVGGAIVRARTDLAESPSAEPVTVESAHRRKDGSEFAVEVRLGALELGHESLMLALARDVSDRQRAERERARLHEELLQAQKMESVGLIAGGVAHDFGNLVTVIMGALGELQAVEGLPDRCRPALEAIESATEQAAGVTKMLLSMSRPAQQRCAASDLHAVVTQCADLLKRVLPRRLAVAVQGPGDGKLFVRVEPTHVQQIVLNLGINARDAMPGGGCLTIATRAATDADAPWLGPNLAPASQAVLAVSDTGVGIAPDVRERIFEPLFTTKDVGKGTGLGLAIVRNIVETAGGAVHVESEPGSGATFLVALPRCDEDAQSDDVPG